MAFKDLWRKRSDRQNDTPPVLMEINPKDRKQSESQGFTIDPWELTQAQAHIEQMSTHSPYSAHVLRSMAETPWISLFKRYYCDRRAVVARPRRGRFGQGFRVAMRDEEGTPTNADKKESKRIERLLLDCGEFRNDDVDPFVRDNFETFTRKLVADSFVFDAMVFETMPDRTGKPACWEARDASTIYRVRPRQAYSVYQPGDAAFVQRVNMQNVAWFSPDQLAFAVQYPSTDIRSAGYGRPVLVELLTILTNIMSAYVYNQNIFKQGGPPGMLALLGDMPQEKFQEFMRGVRYLLTGVKNAHRLPGVNMQGAGADAKWIPFTGYTNQDMQFGEWVWTNFLLLCSLCGVAPEEVGFYAGQHGVSSSMSQGGIDDKVATGQAKGIAPKAYLLEAALNKWIVHRINPDFEYRVCGLEGRSEKDQAELDEIRARTKVTVNELRAEDDMEPIEGGDIILSSVYQAMQTAAAGQGSDTGDGSGKPATDPTMDWGDDGTPTDAEAPTTAKDDTTEAQPEAVKSLRGETLVFEF